MGEARRVIRGRLSYYLSQRPASSFSFSHFSVTFLLVMFFFLLLLFYLHFSLCSFFLFLSLLTPFLPLFFTSYFSSFFLLFYLSFIPGFNVSPPSSSSFSSSFFPSISPLRPTPLLLLLLSCPRLVSGYCRPRSRDRWAPQRGVTRAMWKASQPYAREGSR